MKKQSITALFKKNHGYLAKNQISGRAMYYELLEMVDNGLVERVKNGLFYLEDAALDPTMINVGKMVPGGVLCLYSVWFHYGLTVQIPQTFHVAIEKSRKLKLPDYPSIQLYYWKKEFQELGVVEEVISGYITRIYNLEKSVCDAVKFRTKIGMETLSEILRNYLKRKDRNLTRLMDYAQHMRVAHVLKSYLDVVFGDSGYL